MKARYRPYFCGIHGGMYYCVDKTTGKRTSLLTGNKDEARQIIAAKNNSHWQPILNLQIAKAYLAAPDSGINIRTWQHALKALTNTKQGSNKERSCRRFNPNGSRNFEPDQEKLIANSTEAQQLDNATRTQQGFHARITADYFHSTFNHL